MQILSGEKIKKIENKSSRNLLIFCFICVFFLVAYAFSFTLDNLLISILTGVIGVIVSLIFYYTFVFEGLKLVKLFKDVKQGITQEETYTFISNDIFTEHDGLRLNSINVTYVDEGEIYERTLYFICALEKPELKVGQTFVAQTFRNIITEININD